MICIASELSVQHSELWNGVRHTLVAISPLLLESLSYQEIFSSMLGILSHSTFTLQWMEPLVASVLGMCLVASVLIYVLFHNNAVLWECTLDITTVLMCGNSWRSVCLHRFLTTFTMFPFLMLISKNTFNGFLNNYQKLSIESQKCHSVIYHFWNQPIWNGIGISLWQCTLVCNLSLKQIYIVLKEANAQYYYFYWAKTEIMVVSVCCWQGLNMIKTYELSCKKSKCLNMLQGERKTGALFICSG